jgi:hypothetical protein
MLVRWFVRESDQIGRKFRRINVGNAGQVSEFTLLFAQQNSDILDEERRHFGTGRTDHQVRHFIVLHDLHANHNQPDHT